MTPRTHRPAPRVPASAAKPVRYVAVAADPAASALIGLRDCVGLAAAAGKPDLALAVPGKTNLFGVLEDAFGEAVVKALDRDGRVQAPAVTLHLVTRRIALAAAMPVLACFTTTDQAAGLLASPRCTGLVYAPWSPEDQAAFLAAYPDAVLVDMP